MESFERLTRRLSNALMFIGGLALLALMFHVVADITMKYLFRAPITGTLEIVAWYYMVAIAFLPVAYVQLNRRHLTVEMFTMKMNDRQTALLDAAVATLMIVYVSLLTYLVFEQAIEATQRNEIQDVTFFDMPVWPARWILPLSFGFMMLVLFAQALIDYRFAFTGRGKPTFSYKTTDIQAE